MSQQVRKTAGCIFDDSYELLATLGHGAQTIVYKARKLLPTFPLVRYGDYDKANSSNAHFPTANAANEDSPLPSLPPFVALKVLADADKRNNDSRERFRAEAQALLACAGPNVIGLDNYSANGYPIYLALEYAPHGDLRQLLAKHHGPLAPDVALRVLRQVLIGLESIHAAGFIHRDIKPENLLVTGKASIKISDFSTACLLSDLDATTSLGEKSVGTFDYMPPEALDTGTVSIQNDLYAAAVSCFELLCGHMPFPGTSIQEQFERKARNERIPLRKLVGYDTTEIEGLLDNALSPNPATRFADAAQFRAAVESLLHSTVKPQAKTHRNIQPSATFSYAERKAARNIAATRPSEVLNATQRQMQEMARLRSQGQLTSLRSTRVRTKTEWRELEPFDKRRGTSSGKSFSLKSFGLSAAVAFIALVTGLLATIAGTKPEAIASLSQKLPPQYFAANSFWNSLGGYLTSTPETPYLKLLTTKSEPYAGEISNLFEDGSSVPLMVRDAGVDNRVLLTLGIPGWAPTRLALNPASSSNEIRLAAHGMRLSLWLDENSTDDELQGYYLEHISGRQGSWALRRSGKTWSIE